ncbi:hypothetical protein Tco_0461238, partial [Tanacetum coccineum]
VMVEKVEMEEFVWKHLLHVGEGGGKGLATLGECGGEPFCDIGEGKRGNEVEAGIGDAVQGKTSQMGSLECLVFDGLLHRHMRMEQYLQCIDYNKNGNAPIVTKIVDGKETVIPPTSVEEKAQRRAKLKARSTLLKALKNKEKEKTVESNRKKVIRK